MLDAQGNEMLDPTPVAIPVSLRRPPSRFEEMRAMMGAISRQAAMSGKETEAEANDFDVGDDYDPKSEYEIDEDLRILAEGPPKRRVALPPDLSGKNAPVGSGGPSQGLSGGTQGNGSAVSSTSEPDAA